MSIDSGIHKEIDLWVCLHDGSLESLTHDALARTLTLIVDVPYIWEFHEMPSDSRFHIVLRDVQVLEALEFQSWPGEVAALDGLSWDEQQANSREAYKKGYSTSSDWAAFAARLSASTDYLFINACIVAAHENQSMLVANLMRQDIHDYPTLRITAGHVSFSTGSSNELPLSEFLSLGKAYWDNFAADRPTQELSTE